MPVMERPILSISKNKVSRLNKPVKPSKSKSQAEEIVELRKRLEYLEAENAYLKKLAALVQQRKAQEQKKK